RGRHRAGADGAGGAAVEARREPPRATGGSSLDPPRVLFARLKSASELAHMRRRLFEKGELSAVEWLATRGEVDALLALLEARPDELRDQIELLKVQLAIREADLASAAAQLEGANRKLGWNETLAQRKVISDQEVQGAKQEVTVRAAERAKRQAELAEVRLRIDQATRQLKQAEGLVAQANALVADAVPSGGTPGTPAPPAAPR
ncbi:MAG TPA: hypothetical protein VGH33_18380, partial [Isosphaeraceae bacterium]